MSEIMDRLNKINTRLSEDAFLSNKGLSNEVGIHVFCYDPADEITVRAYFEQLKEQADGAYRLVECDLYKIFLQICEEKRILKSISRMEETKGKDFLKSKLENVATPEAFVEKMKYEPHQKGDILLISGVGKVYPFMAALLPHRSFEVHDDGRIYCDGLSTEGTESREKVLQAKDKDSVAIAYKKLLGMKQAEKRDLIAGKNVVYIYHNAIDTIGETMMTEDKVFEACQSAMAEIKNLVRIITNELNGTNILITADHGFLYSYKPLTVSDKAEKAYVTGLLIETDRRYIISDNGASGEHLLRIPMQDYQCDYYLMVPQDNIRFKTGGGMNYVHGGVSLQEMMVPVITFKNMRATNKKFVESSKAKVELISSGRKVSNNMFSLNFYQKEAVGGKVAACTYNVFFTDAAGKPISDVKTIIADKTSDNGSDRVFRVRFTLKGQEFKKTEEYYLTIMEKDGSGVPEKIAFTIDIAFANDFDF